MQQEDDLPVSQLNTTMTSLVSNHSQNDPSSHTPVRQSSDDIPLELIGSVCDDVDTTGDDKYSNVDCSEDGVDGPNDGQESLLADPDGTKECQESLLADPDGTKEYQESLLAKHLLLVHASHCGECRFVNTPGHKNNGDDEDIHEQRFKIHETCGSNGYGPNGCGHSHKKDYQQQYTKTAVLKHQRCRKPIPAPITVPHEAHTNHNNSFDNGSNSRGSTPKSATNSQHMASFDSGDPMPNDCQRMINTPPPAVLHHEWKTDVIFPPHTDCNNKWAAGVTIFMALALFLGIIAFMVVFFATNGKRADSNGLLVYETVSISAVLKFNLTYIDSYGDRTSQEYMRLHRDMSTMMDDIFYSSTLQDVFKSTVINGFRPGSVYVDSMIQLSALPGAVEDQELTGESLKEYTRKIIYDVIYFGAKDNDVLNSLHARLDGLFITSVVLDFDAIIHPAETTATASALTDDLFVTVKYHGLLNQPQCGTRRRATSRFRIIGGYPAAIGNWPWIGSMDYTVLGHKCAASLIAPQWAITAAHCLASGRDAMLLNIKFGDTSLKTPSPYHQEVGVERIFSHPGYNPVFGDHDIAVLKLKQPVTISQGRVSPVCLQTDEDWDNPHGQCYIAGWGVVDAASTNVSTELQEASLPLVSKEKCSEQYQREGLPDTNVITENMICAGPGDGSVDACQSDSGGPLVCQQQNGQWHLVGVTSFGIGCGHPDYSGVYVRVSKYWDFITSVINGEPSIRCEPITLDKCAGILPYTHTYSTSQKDIKRKVDELLGNVTNLDLHYGNISFSDYKLFVCSVFLPRCQHDILPGNDMMTASQLVPCQQFCNGMRRFVEKTNLTWSYIFDIICSDMPIAAHSSTQLCESKERNFACGSDSHFSVSITHPTILTSPFSKNVPDAFGHLLDCSWFISAPSNAYILIKFREIQLPFCCDILSIGEGGDINNRTSIFKRIRGGSEIKPIVVSINNIWLRLQSDEYTEGPERFSIEFHAISTTANSTDICQNGVFQQSYEAEFPSWWQCDGIQDCNMGMDEQGCDKTNITAKVIYVNNSSTPL